MNECEIPEFYNDKEVVGRKEHYCIECAAPIYKAEKHLAYSGKWAGEFGCGRQHLLCRDLCVLIRDQFNGSNCIGFGEMHEFWSEMYFDRAGERKKPFDDITKKARSMMAVIKWRERRFRSRYRFIRTGIVSGQWDKILEHPDV